MKNSLSVTGIIKTFGKRKVLDNAYLRCESGEITSVFGRNGCGKSTLLKLVFGTLKADEIAISINGRHISAKDIIPQQKIAYLPQELSCQKTSK